MLAIALLLPFHEVKRLLENGELTWESPWEEIGGSSESYKLISNILYEHELRKITTKTLNIKSVNLNGDKLLLIAINITNNTKNTMKISAKWEFEAHEATHVSKRYHIYRLEKLIFKVDINNKLRELFNYYASKVNNVLILLLLSRNAKISYTVSNDLPGEASLSMQPYITGTVLLYPRTVSADTVRLAGRAVGELLGVEEDNIYRVDVEITTKSNQ